MQNNCPCGLVNGIGCLKIILALLQFEYSTKPNVFFMSLPAEMDNERAGSGVWNILTLWCFLVDHNLEAGTQCLDKSAGKQ